MRRAGNLAAIGALLALAACGDLGGNDASNAVANGAASESPGSTEPAASAPAVAAPQPAAEATGPSSPGAALDPALLVGRWGDNGDCTKDIVFAADGTFRSFNGGGFWQVEGDRLILTGSNGQSSAMGIRLDRSGELIVTNADGSTGRSQRC